MYVLLRDSVIREMGEEVVMNGKILGVTSLGGVNEDTNEVDKVHFGVLYAITTDSTIVTPSNQKEIEEGRLMTLGELEEISCSKDCTVENWSAIALTPLKQFLEN